MIVGLLLIVWMTLIGYMAWEAWLDARYERNERDAMDRYLDRKREQERGLWDD